VHRRGEPSAINREPPVNFEEVGMSNKVCLVTGVGMGNGAALRGGAGTAAFAAAKASQRSLAQSAARSLGPQGVHVGYVIVDGVTDMPATRSFLKDRPDDFFLKPEAIADTVYQLARQDRSAWTFEIDLRPFGEKW
jgi:NAD(P)-dependent dehydrogenase (short-subunit alcohol dehydrogenase family)